MKHSSRGFSLVETLKRINEIVPLRLGNDNACKNINGRCGTEFLLPTVNSNHIARYFAVDAATTETQTHTRDTHIHTHIRIQVETEQKGVKLANVNSLHHLTNNQWA